MMPLQFPTEVGGGGREGGGGRLSVVLCWDI